MTNTAPGIVIVELRLVTGTLAPGATDEGTVALKSAVAGAMAAVALL
ncbi:hypothetical protein [Nocardioides sp. B-3]